MSGPTRGHRKDALTIAREMPGTPEEVFRALTDAEQLMRWWGLSRAHVNLRPGGEYRFEFGGSDPDAGWVKGQYQVLDPPRRIVKTWFSSRHPELRNSVELRFDPAGTGTRLTIVHSGLAGRPEVLQEYETLWAEALGRLAARG
jgi:uncharacterized protein YndB with AHSA1/START domain